MKLAQIQMHVTPDKTENLRRAAGDVLLPLRQRLLPRLRRA